MTDLLAELNAPQREAATYIRGPVLVLAGAGSGKTRVITYRIAWLIQNHIPPSKILALTFTNKAAGEMLSRVNSLLGKQASGVWISTFHSFGARILRKEIHHLGGKSDFAIYDEQDQKNLLKECLKQLEIDEKKFPPARFRDTISQQKQKLLDPESFEIYAATKNDPYKNLVSEVYKFYQKRLERNNALDFGDLIMKLALVWQTYPKILEKYQDRFQHIMVDEYQDTDHAQYVLTKLLAQKYKNICVVGDEDQVIYSWRGTDIENLLHHFERDYPLTKVIHMMKNYRSTKKIITLANVLIKHNLYRHQDKPGLSLSSEALAKEGLAQRKKAGGTQPVFQELLTETEEANYVAQEIESLSHSYPYGDIAVFYRTNAQSRIFEEIFADRRIPYILFGTVRFYERREIKDILAWLWVIINPNDSFHLKRIINVPPRGIGQRSVVLLEEFARGNGLSLFESINQGNKIKLHPAALKSLQEFNHFLGELIRKKEEFTIRGLTEHILEKTGYLAFLKQEKTPEVEDRIENVKELISSIVEFEEKETKPTLRKYLEKISLASDLEQGVRFTLSKAEGFSPEKFTRRNFSEGGYVTLMTLHLAKGLEFPAVFITGLEEGLLPHINSLDDPRKFEEERRLCYVGITRAKERLYLTSAFQRRVHGQRKWNIVSPFVQEMGLPTAAEPIPRFPTQI